MSLHLPIKMPPKRTTAVILMPAWHAEAGDADGVHFTMESHPRLGKAIA